MKSLLHILSVRSLRLSRTAICIEIIESGLAAIRSFTFQKEKSTVLCIKWKAVSSHLLLVERHDVGSNAGYAKKKICYEKINLITPAQHSVCEATIIARATT